MRFFCKTLHSGKKLCEGGKKITYKNIWAIVTKFICLHAMLV